MDTPDQLIAQQVLLTVQGLAEKCKEYPAFRGMRILLNDHTGRR